MSTVERFGCEATFRRLDLLVDGEASPGELALAEQHFAECPACAAERTFELTVLRTVRARLREVRMPADLKDRILDALRLEADLDDDPE